MMRYKILNAESKGYSAKARAILGKAARVDYFDRLSGVEIRKKIAGYDGLIVRLNNYIGKDILKNAKSLLFIASATTGLDHIDTAYAGSRSIEVLSLGGETEFLKSIYATAEYTFALILALTRKIPFAHMDAAKGRWDRYKFIGSELNGKTLGIIGYGRVGKLVAGYARRFGMKVVAHDIDTGNLNKLLKVSDIVSVHLPLNKKTEGMMTAGLFRKMARRPYFINTSRGQIVNERALLSALESGRIKGAAIDVVREERSRNTGSSPLIKYAGTHDNLIITPHIAGASFESMEKTEVFIAQKIVKYLKDREYGKA